MIPLEQAIPQVLRFSGCPGWPSTKEGQDELVKTIAEVAADPAHAIAIVDACERQSRWAPTPHDFILMARWTAPPTDDSATRPFCGKCDGSGWLRIPEHEGGGLPGVKYTSVKPCECRGGT